MKKLLMVSLLISSQWLVSCSPVKTVITNQYNLESFSSTKLASQWTPQSILITAPEAVAGYQTDQMVYIKERFKLSAFAHSAWISPPADMLYPLILQSVQQAGYFYTVASSPFSEGTDYRLDTQLIKLQQNFLTKPSEVELVVKVVLSHVTTNRVVASRIMSQRSRCPVDNPYGGVIAANLATRQFTAELSQFIIAHVKGDRRSYPHRQ